MAGVSEALEPRMNRITALCAVDQVQSKRGAGFDSEHTCTEPGPRGGAGRRPQSGPLGNSQLVLPRSKTVESSRRSERWFLRGIMQEITGINRLKHCGRKPIANGVSLRMSQVDGGGHRAGYAGLETCGSVWACPVCAAKITHERQEELAQVIRKALDEGLHVSMLTLTQRHHRGQTLSDLWESLSYAWGRVTSGRKWVQFKEQLGLRGYARAVEVTHGENGWHAHVHAVMITERRPEVTPLFFQRKQGRRKLPYPVEMRMPADFVADTWEKALAKKGIGFLRNRGGMDWQTAKPSEALGLASYVGKMNAVVATDSAGQVASEATLGQFKRAKGSNMTPFQMLGDIALIGDADLVDLWREYERVSKGKRALTWSRGLRAWAGLGQERTDEEIAEDQAGDDTVFTVNNSAWGMVRPYASFILDLAEQEGADKVFEWLDERDVPYWVPGEEDSRDL